MSTYRPFLSLFPTSSLIAPLWVITAPRWAPVCSAASYQLSVLYLVVYICQCYSHCSSHRLLPNSPPFPASCLQGPSLCISIESFFFLFFFNRRRKFCGRVYLIINYCQTVFHYREAFLHLIFTTTLRVKY